MAETLVGSTDVSDQGFFGIEPGPAEHQSQVERTYPSREPVLTRSALLPVTSVSRSYDCHRHSVVSRLFARTFRLKGLLGLVFAVLASDELI